MATYRLQFGGPLRFEDARTLVPYLDALGITDLYASPLFLARSGSTHGYDLADSAKFNPDLGTEEELDALILALKEREMGLVMDIVPNHMAASSENRWWMDVLETGIDSPYAAFFDIDWDSSRKSLKGKVLLPILEGPYWKVLENQGLSLHLEESGFVLRYSDVKLPLAVKSYLRILSHRIEVLDETHGSDSPAFRELWDLIAAVEHLPDVPAGDSAAASARFRKEVEIKQTLWQLFLGRPEIRSFLEENLRIFNGRKEVPESFELLDRLLAEQHYWPSYWRLANEEINYRRFFAISDLVSLRVEDPRVFEASHELVLRLAREGKVTGLRVDHIDGLYDPLGYLTTLREHLLPEVREPESPPAGFYVVVEKILQEGEALPPEWPACGTTGYDFLNAVNGVFVSARGIRELDGIYARLLGEKTDFTDVVYHSKKMIMETQFAGEMHALGQHLGSIAEHDRYGHDLPRKELRQALIEVTACFPVYRTYIRGHDVSPRDRLTLARALKEAQRRAEGASGPVFEYLKRVLEYSSSTSLTAEQKEERLRFLRRWQQFTGPIMAKGLEDTSLYRFNRLISMNEVGGDPVSAGVPPNAFHRRAGETLARWPHTLNATSTHDTKRSEDVRARINVLSELPEEWEKRFLAWSLLNEEKKSIVDRRTVPGRNEEILLYQTLLGSWPLDDAELPALPERVAGYMIKAVREAQVYSHWNRPNLPYESAIGGFRGFDTGGRHGEPFPGGFPRVPEEGRLLRGAEQPFPAPPQDRIPGRARFLPGDGTLGLLPRGPGQSAARGFRAAGDGPQRDVPTGGPGRPVPRPGTPVPLGGRADQAVSDREGLVFPQAAAGAVPFRLVPAAAPLRREKGSRRRFCQGTGGEMGDRRRPPAGDPIGASGRIPPRSEGLGRPGRTGPSGGIPRPVEECDHGGYDPCIRGEREEVAPRQRRIPVFPRGAALGGSDLSPATSANTGSSRYRRSYRESTWERFSPLRNLIPRIRRLKSHIFPLPLVNLFDEHPLPHRCGHQRYRNGCQRFA